MRTKKYHKPLFMLILCLLTNQLTIVSYGDELQYPSYLTRYDITTPGDAVYLHKLDRFLGDPRKPEDWLLFKQIKKEMGKKIAEILDARIITSTVTTAMSIEGQEAGKPIRDIVNDCSRILHMEPPQVWIKQSPLVNAYVTKLEEPHFLVIHSGLLELYEGKPEELRFIIGHELGHLKCEHLIAGTVGWAILEMLGRLDENAIPQDKNMLLPSIGLGFFLSWCRESEISADRAGFLCCQNREIAEQALLRLLHGLQFDSPWLDPVNKAFDPERVVNEFEHWENEPFVKFVLKLQRFGTSHPFIPDRIAALRLWDQKGMLNAIISRKGDAAPSKYLQIKSVSLSGLQEKDEKVNSYCNIFHENQKINQLSTLKNNQNPVWKDINQITEWRPGQPIFMEVWNSKLSLLPDKIIGEVGIFPIEGQKSYVISLERNVLERKVNLKTPVAQIDLDFLEIPAGDQNQP
jgi:Zn-dependent protease with chaperone function